MFTRVSGISLEFPNKNRPVRACNRRFPRAGLSFPDTVTKRNGKATIYRYAGERAGRPWKEFKVAVFDSTGKRQLKSFADFGTALKEAESRLDALGRGLLEVTVLQGGDRLDYLEACRLLPAG